MAAPVSSLRTLALDVWNSSVQAVGSRKLVRAVLERHDNQLSVCGQQFDLTQLTRIIVVGAGKAGAGMADAVEDVLGPDVLREKVTGWLNVPADCVKPLSRIHLHAARPAGLNEPTADGVAGALKILQLVERLRETELCLVLLSGGGSALLPAPCFGISLADKQAVTRLLSQRGATIQELNTVRKQLSLVKGGGLGRAIRAGHMHSLIISDVISDPLDIIASGPTVDDSSTPQLALEVLDRVIGDRSQVPASIIALLTERCCDPSYSRPPIDPSRVSNHIIGNNAIAVDAAARRATKLGFDVRVLGTGLPGIASEVGLELAELCLKIREELSPESRPVCLVSGGEPVVKLAQTNRPRSGGRNQELVLSACNRLQHDCRGIAIISGGTDGEDGPTDAAGAFLDEEVLHQMRDQNLVPSDFLAINNSYGFFSRTGGLLLTGPTHTNVMDVRVAVIQPAELQ